MAWPKYVPHIRNICKNLVGINEDETPLWRRRCRWKDNIKINLKAKEYKGMGFFQLIQYRAEWQALVNTVMNLRAP
jgi:hypothetical protein